MLKENATIKFRRLGIFDERPSFDCGDPDLNEFFLKDSKQGTAELLSVTYAVEVEEQIVAFFCVSNDAIRSEDTSKSRFKKICSQIPRNKRYSSMPAVKIGRLAIATSFQGMGIGTRVIDIIKVWFTEGNKTGCRFIVVDAKNNSNTLRFYEKNGFSFLDTNSTSEKDSTRLMFFDFLLFKKD